MYFTTKVEPIEVTAWPILFAPVAKKAAILSVVPAITSTLLLKPNSINSLFLRKFKLVPGDLINGRAFYIMGS